MSCGHTKLDHARTTVELFGREGHLAYDTAEIDHAEIYPIVRAEFAAAVHAGRPHELDVRRGLRLQELIDQALRSLTSSRMP